MPQPQGGHFFRLDTMSGRFLPGVGGSVGDGTCIVTGAPDKESAYQALNAGGAVPSPLNGKWTVDYAALMTAIGGSTRVVLTPWTF